MIGQVVVAVPQAKRLIAKAILALPQVQQALDGGRVVLKSGTTVSAVAELLGVPPMRIGGRIAPDGARGAKYAVEAPHIVIMDRGVWRLADRSLPDEIADMGPGDVFITGANALDTHGVAGLLAGLEYGSTAGRSLPALWSEGITTIIAVGLEKLVPGSIIELCRCAGRKRVDKSMGMAVGLMPLFGKVVTEKEALEILTGVSATVIAAGGILGAEGATTMLIEGTDEQVDAAFDLIEENLGARYSGDPKSLIPCDSSGSACQGHRGCIYKGKLRAKQQA